MGYSKQQLRKFEKHLNAKRKKEQRDNEAAKQAHVAEGQHKKAKGKEKEL